MNLDPIEPIQIERRALKATGGEESQCVSWPPLDDDKFQYDLECAWTECGHVQPDLRHKYQYCPTCGGFEFTFVNVVTKHPKASNPKPL